MTKRQGRLLQQHGIKTLDESSKAQARGRLKAEFMVVMAVKEKSVTSLQTIVIICCTLCRYLISILFWTHYCLIFSKRSTSI